jgi:uncharacterized protein YaaR (DUF327 family)
MLKFIWSLLFLPVMLSVGEDSGGQTAEELAAAAAALAGGGGADEKVTKLEQGLEALMGTVLQLANGQNSTQEAVKQLSEALANNAKPPVKEAPVITEEDLETMSRADLVKMIQGQQNETIQNALKPLMDKLQNTDLRLDSAITSVTVEKFKEGHPDLLEWKNEIGELIKAGRATTVADAYSLVRAENPDKVKVVDAKYKKSDKPAGDRFTGSFQGFPTAAGENKRMSATDAAAAAWDKATTENPGLEKFLTGE